VGAPGTYTGVLLAETCWLYTGVAVLLPAPLCAPGVWLAGVWYLPLPGREDGCEDGSGRHIEPGLEPACDPAPAWCSMCAFCSASLYSCCLAADGLQRDTWEKAGLQHAMEKGVRWYTDSPARELGVWMGPAGRLTANLGDTSCSMAHMSSDLQGAVGRRDRLGGDANTAA
jgi:hypothetical protein